MKIYPHGTAVTEAVRFVDLNGDPVVPTAATVRVLDQAGAEIVPATPVSFAPGDMEAEIVVPGDLNVLTSGIAQALRVIELTMETAVGPVVALARYAIRRPQRLIVLSNSFQTFDEALLESMDMPRMDGWSMAEEGDKIAALIEAHDRLTRIGYRVPQPYAGDVTRRLDLREIEIIPPRRWQVMGVEEFLEMPAHFRRALRRAQIVEADVVLNGDVIAGRRRAGLMSESVGESSMMFRPGKPLNLGVSEQALAYLASYVDIRMGLTRA